MRQAPIAVLVVALIALFGSVAWAANSSGWSWHHGPAMMGVGTGRGSVHDLADARARFAPVAQAEGLRVGEVMQFQRNFYAQFLDQQGNGATEVLLDPASGRVSTEYGPAMMWNTKYGHIGAGAGMMGGSGSGMMGGSGSGMMGGAGMMGGTSPNQAAPAEGPVSSSQAATIARQWLETNLPGTTIEQPDAFPGYFTIHILRDGKATAMLSVNAATGAVWYHWWHGAFVGMSE
jgi:hypothetical protein